MTEERMAVNAEIMEQFKSQIEDLRSNLMKIYKNNDNIFTEEYAKHKRGYYTKAKGVYALFISQDKWEKWKNYFDVEDFDFNKPFYIGKTCNSFQARVVGAGGHMKGGNTSVSAKLYNYIFQCDGNEKPEDTYRDIGDYKNKSIENHKEKVTNLFKNKDITVKFLPIDLEEDSLTKFAITVIEETLIQKFNPPLNTQLKDECK